MAEEAVLQAFVTLLQNPVFTGGATPLLRAVYEDAPEFPYQGAFPFAFPAAATQSDTYIESSDTQQQGFYTIGYFDDLGEQSGLTEAQIRANARKFVKALKTQIRTDVTLGGAVIWAGAGRGIQTRWTLAGPIELFKGQPLFLLPVNIDVLDVPNGFLT